MVFGDSKSKPAGARSQLGARSTAWKMGNGENTARLGMPYLHTDTNTGVSRSRSVYLANRLVGG